MNSSKRVRAFQIKLEFVVLIFEERGKPEYPEKNLSEQGREPTTNSTHIWGRRRDLSNHCTTLAPRLVITDSFLCLWGK